MFSPIMFIIHLGLQQNGTEEVLVHVSHVTDGIHLGPDANGVDKALHAQGLPVK